MFAASKTSRPAVAGATNDTNIANVSLLLHGDGTNGGQNQTFIDGANGYTTARYGNTSQGSFSPFRSADWSNYFDGSGDYLALGGSSLAVGTADFTVEFWLFLSSYGSSNMQIIETRTAQTGDTANWAIYLENVSGTGTKQLRFFSAAADRAATSSAFPANTWQHVAVSRVSGVTRFFVNGVQAGSNYTDANNYASTGWWVGVYPWPSGTAYLYGYMSNLRLTRTGLYGANFTPSQTPLDTTANTLLLTCASNTFEDLSAATTTISRYGDTRVTPFSPFGPTTRLPKSYGMKFDGSGDYLTVADSANLELGSSNFTIEVWAYISSSSQCTILSKRASNIAQTSLALFKNSSNGVALYLATAGGAWDIFNGASLGTITLNTWTHISVCRSGSNFYGSLNGTVVSLGTSAATIGDNASSWGIGGDIDGVNSVNGCLSNLRIVKGTALYTASFTPPTSQLTNGVGDTTLLACRAYLPFDESAYGTIGSVTANGNAQPTKANPFGYILTATTGYDSATMGASAYFDGAADSVEFTVFGQPGYNFAGDFCMEAWVYPTMDDASGYSVLFSSSSANNQLYFDAGDGGMGLTIGATNVIAKTGTAVKIGAWNHLMWTRNGSTCRMFCNGTLIGTGTSSASLNISAVGYYAFAGNYEVNGYVAGVRLRTSNTLLTQQFTPLLTPTQADGTTQFLLTMDNGSIIDHSQNNVIETVGNAQISTSTKKYGTGALYFDGTGDYLLMPYHPSQVLGNGNFTIEAWVYPTSLTGTYKAILVSSLFNVSTTSDLQYFLYLDTSGYPTFKAYSGTTAYTVFQGTALPLNTWTHLAVVRNGANLTLYVNGTSVSTISTLSTLSLNGSSTSLGLKCGGYVEASSFYYFTGYIDEVRVTNGVARYLANFTPPSAAFPNN